MSARPRPSTCRTCWPLYSRREEVRWRTARRAAAHPADPAHAAGTEAVFRSEGLLPFGARPALGSCTRQGEEKGRAVPLNTLHRNLSRMRSDYLLHNIEA